MKNYFYIIPILIVMTSCQTDSKTKRQTDSNLKTSNSRFYDFDFEIEIQSSFCDDDFKYFYYGNGVYHNKSLNEFQRFDKMTLYFLTYKKCIRETIKSSDKLITKIDTIKISLTSIQLDSLYILSRNFMRFEMPSNLSEVINPPPPAVDGYYGTMTFDFNSRGNKFTRDFNFNNNNNIDYLNLFRYLDKLKNGL